MGTSRQIPPAADLLRTPPQDPQGGADPHAGLGQSLRRLRERIDAAQALHARAPGSVALLAVSKAFPAATVAAAAAHGQHAFGENYVQEAVAKIAALRADAPAVPLEWHFIGPIQSNKTRAIAAHFDWVQSVERVEIARRLSAQRPAHLPPLQVLLQVNIDAEPSKSGVAPEALDALAQAVASLPRLRLRGLMAIPRASGVAQEQRAGFARMRALFERTGARLAALAQPGHADGDPTACWDTLSMGMSADFELAIAEGSTLVRVGSALFGERP